MRAKKLRILVLVLIATMLFGLVACGNNTTPANGDPISGTQRLVVAMPENVVGFDPGNSKGNADNIVAMVQYEALVETDHTGNYSPCLAKEWESSEDGTEWTFYLRDDVTFSNGSKFDSNDVVVSYQRQIDDRTLGCSATFWAELASVEAIDEYTVKISTNSPMASFLLSVSQTYIIDDEMYAEYGEEFGPKRIGVGTGPCVYEDWVDGGYALFSYNENYWNKSEYDPYYDELMIRTIGEASSAIAAHLTGDISAYTVCGGISTDLLSMYNGSEDKIDIVSYKDGNYYILGCNCAEGEIFNDVNLRKAVSLCINREDLAAVYGDAYPVNGIISTTCFGYNEDIPMWEYNPDEAAKLVAASAYNGEEIEISTKIGLQKSEELALLISESMNAIGFNTKVNMVESAVFSDIRSQGNYDMYLANDMATGGDPSKYLSSKVINDIHKHGLKNDEVQRLASAIITTLDVEERYELCTEFVELTNSLYAPHIMLFQTNANNAVNKGITGIEFYPDSYISYKYVDYDPSLVQ